MPIALRAITYITLLQALAAGDLSKYLSGTANILEDLEDRLTELLQPWGIKDGTKRLSKSANASDEIPRLPPEESIARARVFIRFLLDESHTFVARKVENLMMNPSFLQQAQQEELKGMIQLFRAYDEAFRRLCGRVRTLVVDLEHKKYLQTFNPELEKMIAEYKSQIRSTISLVCDGLLTIMHPDCTDDLVIRADIEVRQRFGTEIQISFLHGNASAVEIHVATCPDLNQ